MMHRTSFLISRIRRAITAFGMALAVCGCSNTAEYTGAGIGITAFLGHWPNNEIEQIYYLGVFDPEEQVPGAVYRVRVHGQSSSISRTRFASGWVPAALVDSLGTNIAFNKESGAVEVTRAEDDPSATLQSIRKLMVFGPEGFREAPEGYRLVIVMASNPEKFFQAIDETLGAVSEMKVYQDNSKLKGLLFEELTKIRSEQELLGALAKEVEADMPERKGVE
ncbi:MAG: hypothetical protein JSU94_13440 [Phycisphaerales bacterium]|nr:MAG: hypothetical protein JSU94_13440 [Phycisphaerales bacterium]